MNDVRSEYLRDANAALLVYINKRTDEALLRVFGVEAPAGPSLLTVNKLARAKHTCGVINMDVQA
jgi:hypothetical protein